MYRKILLICLALIILCAGADAQAQQFTIEFSIHHDGEITAESMVLDTDSDGFRVFSTLFPGCVLSGSFPGLKNLFSSSVSAEAVPSFSAPDIKDVFSAWSTALNPQSHAGFFSGDAFDYAVSELYGTCSAQDILTLAFSLSEKIYPLLPETEASSVLQALSEYGITSVSAENDIVYRIFDGGKYLSLTRMAGNSVIRTLSYDLSDANTARVVSGYAEGGKNYYWVVESVLVSSQEIILSACLRADPEKAGYRAVMNEQPIVQESWTFTIPENHKAIAFTGSIDPQNDLDDILISGEIRPSGDELFYAELRFRGSQESRYFTLSMQKGGREISDGPLQEMKISDLLSPGNHDDFSAEIVDGMARIYSAIVTYVPLDYTVRLMNLFN